MQCNNLNLPKEMKYMHNFSNRGLSKFSQNAGSNVLKTLTGNQD